MFSKEELLKRPNYQLTVNFILILSQQVDYIQSNNLTQKDVAERLGVSSAYVSQVLNGNFNFTLKKLIEIGLMVGKIPAIEFVDFTEFWRREKEGTVVRPTISVTQKIHVHVLPVQHVHHIRLTESNSSQAFIKGPETIQISELEYCPN